MKLDSTRFKCFVSSPERYRILYALNFASKQLSPELALGIAMHEFMDADARGKNWGDIAHELSNDGIQSVQIEAAEILAKALVERYPANGATLISEREFEHKIPGSEHSIVGKIDRVVLQQGYTDKFCILDWKSKGNNKWRSLYEDEKLHDVQAGFYKLGARTWGYGDADFRFVVACKSSPVDIWEIDIPQDTWTEEKLRQLERDVCFACEAIQTYTDKFGIEEPWPHTNHSFPCNKDAKWCETREICQLSHRADTPPIGFCIKEPHLEILRETK